MPSLPAIHFLRTTWKTLSEPPIWFPLVTRLAAAMYQCVNDSLTILSFIVFYASSFPWEVWVTYVFYQQKGKCAYAEKILCAE